MENPLIKSQIPSTKSQINFKISITETSGLKSQSLVRLGRIGHWYLFGICDLLFDTLFLHSK
jgi:hypothetical protein